jgi:hypothetical protein
MSASAEQLATELKEILAFNVRRRLAEEKISISTFARRINTGRISIRRLLDPKNTAITLTTMTKAVHALGLEMMIVVRPRPLDELVPLAAEYAATKDDAKAARLEDQFIAGYYGKRINIRIKTSRQDAKHSRRSTAASHAKSSTGQPATRSSPTPAAAGAR